MLVNLDVNQESVFIPMKNSVLLILAVFALSQSGSCSKKARPEQIPTGPVNLSIDLNLPSNQKLLTIGSYGYFQGGIKGILVVHDFDDQWYAFERTCAWQPLNACSIVWADSLNLNLKCGSYVGNKFTNCCESLFSFNGYPSKGPAIGRLAQYQIQRSGNLIYVYN
jgi:hypothetical protein